MRKNKPVKVHTLNDFAQMTPQENAEVHHCLAIQTEQSRELSAERLSTVLIAKKYEKLLEFRDMLEENRNSDDEEQVKKMVNLINEFVKNGDIGTNHFEGDFLKTIYDTGYKISNDIMFSMIAHCISDLGMSVKGVLPDVMSVFDLRKLIIILENIVDIKDMIEIANYYYGKTGELSTKKKGQLFELLQDNGNSLFDRFSSVIKTLSDKKYKGINNVETLFQELGFEI